MVKNNNNGERFMPRPDARAAAMLDGGPPLLISTLPPTRTHERAALGVSLFLFAAFLAVLPVATIKIRQIDVFIPIVAIVMFLNDSITASLLLAQFSVLRTRALLALANGYLFTALIVVPYALLWPGAFSPMGLFGAGWQSPGWLFVIWHVGLPTSVIIYSLLRGREEETPQIARSSVRPLIYASIVGNLAIICALTWFVIRFQDSLPVMVSTLNTSAGIWHYITVLILSACIGAVALQWRRRRRSVLDLWLLVVSLAWLLDSILLNVIGSRYDIGWYANRGFAILSATLVLLVLLSESTMVYAQLAISMLAQRREREGRLMSMCAMLAAVEHEIRQPLGAIVANANAGRRWLSRSPPEVDEARAALDAIAADGHRSSEVVHSVRAMFDKSDEAASTLDANEVIKETIALVREELQSRRIAVDLELAPRLPRVSASRGQLQQVMLNLVTNAADAMRSVDERAAVLTVASKPIDSNAVEVTVADSGIGIDPKIADRIFDAFFTTKSNGMGMGLAICRSIVEAHGGTLSASAGVPHGAVFQLILPGSR